MHSGRSFAFKRCQKYDQLDLFGALKALMLALMPFCAHKNAGAASAF
jgi:hypothetical protein